MPSPSFGCYAAGQLQTGPLLGHKLPLLAVAQTCASGVKIILIALFFTLVITDSYGQGLLWQKCYYVGKLGTSFESSTFNNGILHENGGILAVSTYYGVVYNSYGFISRVRRVSSTGDSLGTYMIPGYTKGYQYTPQFIGKIDSSRYLLYCPNTKYNSLLNKNYPSYLVTLDSSGQPLDSVALDSPLFSDSILPRHVAQFSSQSVIMTDEEAGQDSVIGIYTTWQAVKVRLPQGFVEWHKTFRIHPQINENPRAVIMPGGKIWVYGVSGPSVVVVKLDSLGNQTGFQILYTTPTSVKPDLTSMLPLPEGKLALSLYYSPLSPQYGSKPGASVLMVMDTLGNPVWQISKFAQYRVSPTTGFAQVYGANLDGSINYLRDSIHNGTSYSFLEKRAADSTLLYSWPLTTKGDIRAYEINGVVYAGNEEAYVYGNGGNSVSGQPGDYVAKVTGFGDPFVPTEIRARGGPRAAISAVLYPNPAQGFVQLQIEKAMPYKIVTITGAVVQEGTANPKIPIDIAALPPALYQLILSDGQQKVVKRFVKIDN